MSEKEQLKKKEEGAYNRAPMDAPPPYEESQSQSYDRPPPQQPPAQEYQQPYYGNQQGYSQGYYDKPDYGSGSYAPNNQYQGYPAQQPPPNTYTIKPDKVNISIAPPQHVNPQYQEYLAREQQRIQMGDYPDNYGKHGAPLNKGKTSKNASKGFPGRSGATYHEAANR
ncbi:hypothetical protein JA1_002068 [Spathaspora sp. JA1]|nr:hypothetical protein JA1_002068 [Spathaspora sp. JA1]